MNKLNICLLLIIGALLISSCSSHIDRDAEKLPGIDVPLKTLNQKMDLLIYPGMQATHKNGEMLAFLIRNKSNETIIFNHDFGSLIFIKKDGEWKQIENKSGYPEGKNILPTFDDDPTGLVLTVLPEVGDLTAEATARILVIGHVIDRPAEQVGAYIDVQYEP